MTKVTVDQQFQTNQYLIISRQDENDTIITSRVVISDENTNQIKVVDISQGPQGVKGEVGTQGVAGKDANQFEVLSISSGGTNNTTYSSGNIIFFDGEKLSSSNHSVQDVLDQAALASNAVTGILTGPGLSKTDGTNNVTVNVELGEGLEISAGNEIKIDGTIARTAELDLGQIEGQVPISKGGTSNNFYTQNQLVYYDGFKIKSFPIATGNFIFSGVNVDIVAGSGLVGGGALEIPNGSVVINIPSSSDILVEDNNVNLSVTGTAGTYSKVTTDSKGRVVSGDSLSQSDIVSILGYTPFHLGNSGPGSLLDADRLDNQEGSYYSDASNLTGTINTSVLPSSVVPGQYTKVGVDSNGLVTTVLYADKVDIVNSLGYTPVPDTGVKTVYGDTTLQDDVTINGQLSVFDNLPLFATNSPNLLPDTPRGVSFVYGGAFSNKTGLIAYYPAADELKLVTNVFASGADIDGDGDSDYQDDINGGSAESVFVLQNLDGDQSTILLKNIADTLYVKKTTDETINGLKTFADGITVKGKVNISPNLGVSESPLELYGNTNVVVSLNADLLDGKHGRDYRDAAQMTGAFSYENVTFDHIQGTHNYLSKFNDTVNDPAGRIDSTVIQQDSNNDIVVDSPNNLSMGTGNLSNANRSISVGPNTISSNNSLAVGEGHVITSQNSVALGKNASVNGINSIALGNHGIAYLPNQIAVGAFNVKTDGIPNGQIALGFAGTNKISMANNSVSWDLLTVGMTVTGDGIPEDTTITSWDKNEKEIYLSKVLTQIVANSDIVFVSSVERVRLEHGQYTSVNMHLEGKEIGNSWTSLTPTIQIPNNKTLAYQAEVLVTKAFGTGVAHFKLESGVFKNATFRNSNNIVEIINKTTHPQIPKKNELFNNSQIKNHYHTFDHTNEQRALQDVKVNVPPLQDNDITTQNVKSNYRYTKINKAASGTYRKTNDGNLVLDIYEPLYSGTFFTDDTNRGIKITSQNHGVTTNSFVDLSFKHNSSYSLNDRAYKAYSVIDHNTFFVERPTYTGFLSYYEGSSTIDYAKLIINLDSVGTDHGATGLEYVSGLLNIATKIYTTGPEGVQIFSNGIKHNENDYDGSASLSIDTIPVPKKSSYPSGLEVTLIPLASNVGSVFVEHKQDVSGTFNSAATEFRKTKGIYTRRKSHDGVMSLDIYGTGLNNEILLPHTPLSYELCTGYKDDDNSVFEVGNINDQFFLKAKAPLDYESKNIYCVRLKAQDRLNNSSKEKYFTVTVNDTRAPYRHYSIPDQTIDISETFSYTVPSNLFNAEDDEGALIFSSIQQSGSALPSWLSFNTSSRVFTGSPDGYDLGTYNIRVFANNNFSGIFDDFFLTVTDNAVQVFDAERANHKDITDIQLLSSNIDENAPSGSIVGQISGVGSYDPYISFSTAQNNFKADLVDGKDLFEVTPITHDYPTTTISGDLSKIPVSGLLENSALPDDCRLEAAYTPFTISGTPGLIDGRLHLINAYRDNSQHIFSGLQIFNSATDKLSSFFTVESFNDYSIFVGDREVLTTEKDLLFPEEILTEAGNQILTRHSNIVDVSLFTEENEFFRSEASGSTTEVPLFRLSLGKLTENIFWASGYPGYPDANLLVHDLLSFTSRSRDYSIIIDTIGNLDNFNPSPQSGLKRSNIKYGSDRFNFRNTVQNPVLALYGIGSGDLCTLLSEDNNLITSEDSDDIVSNSENHHGTRVELSDTYEIFDSYHVLKDNGKLKFNTFDNIMQENGDFLVHDYAISAKSGDVCLSFPGDRVGDIVLTYPDAVDMSDSVYNYYYNWGKLIPFKFINDKFFVKTSKPYSGSNSTRTIRYNEDVPQSSNYRISGLKTYLHTIQSGDCPSDVGITGIKGFATQENSHNVHYATGVAEFYTHAGTGEITLNTSRDVNLDSRQNNNVNFHTVASSNSSLDLPMTTQYSDIEIVDANSIKVKNYFYLPDSGINGNGTFTANFDKKHNYIEEASTIINRLPIEFTNTITTLSGINTVSGYRPKDYVFNIDSINGNKITVRDDMNYLLKEDNRQDYFDQALKGKYITNGIAFSGSFFHNDSRIYDVRYNDTNILNKNFVAFEYDISSKIISFILPSGTVKEYDELIITFPEGYNYSDNVLHSLVTKENFLTSSSLTDLEPNKDSVLLETSTSVDPNAGLEQVRITGMLDNVEFDINGTCFIDYNLPNRLQSGLLLNHSGSLINGYEMSSFVSGFSFTGVIPKNNNVLSTNISSLILDEHIGKSSVFATGNNLFYSGARVLRQATSNDIGHGELYLIDSSDNLDPTTDLIGVGSNINAYKYDFIQNNQGTGYMDFLYLGQNTNSINLNGVYLGSGINTKLQVFKTPFADQIYNHQISRTTALPNRVKETVLNQEYTVAANPETLDGVEYLKSINLTLSNIQRFDIVRIQLVGLDFADRSQFDFSVNTVDNIDVKPYILEGSSSLNTVSDYLPYINPNQPDLIYTPVPTLDANDCIDCTTNLPQYIPERNPEYSTLAKHDYHILPIIRTNNKYCGVTYDKNKQLWFNGNILKINQFDSGKTYLSKDDELEILSWNDTAISSTGVTKFVHKFNSTNENSVISGISIQGARSIPPKPSGIPHALMFQNAQRFNYNLGVSHNELLHNRGNVSLIKSTSGQFNLYDYNNIHYHTYGGTTSNYPLDINGKLVSTPQTGIYTVSHNDKLCESGTLCVRISAYNISAFSGIPDIRDRRTFGELPNNIDVNGVKGRIRPFGVNKKMYFDFKDDFAAISDDYYIEDLIEPNIISINVPYNSNHVGKSGLVYIIDSDQNIKANLNPNLDNDFIVSQGSLSDLNQQDKKIFNYYDRDSKRWKHTIHLKNDQIAYSGYDIELNDTDTKFLSLNPNKIEISGIQYSFDAVDPVFTTLIGTSLTVPSSATEVKFKIITLEGDQNLFSSNTFSTPRVALSGIGYYKTEFEEPVNYGWHGNGWTIGVEWEPPAENFSNRDMTIRVSDFTGSTDKLLNISKYLVPEINLAYTGYVVSGTNNWELTFDISNIDVSALYSQNKIAFDITDIPEPGQIHIKHMDVNSIVYSGGGGTTTGTFYPKLVLKDITTSPYSTLASGLGAIVVGTHLSNRPTYDLQLNNLSSTYYLNIEDESKIKFQIPALLGPVSTEVTDNLNITFNTNSDYSLILSSSLYNSDTKRFDIIATPQNIGNTNYYENSAKFVNQSVSISIKQAVYDEYGAHSYQTYTDSFVFNIVFYKPVQFEKIINPGVIPFTVNNPWTMDFYIASGVTEHDAYKRPNARVFNTPNIGLYQGNPIEYDTTYEYDSTLKKWKVQIISSKDIFGNYVDNTGLYPIDIYIEDDLTSSTSNDSYVIQYNDKKTMKNISSDVYGTPNNEFFTKVDSIDLNEQSSNDISFPSSLKEGSISLSNPVRKYDRDLNLWQNSYIGNKMTDKFDVRLNTNGSQLAIECKGIGKDKIIAVAKFDTIEIESNELQGLPLTITGIVGYTGPNGSGQTVEQGIKGWELQFKTIGGLAHANYPPTIRLTDMPTACSGFDPLIDTQMQCVIVPPLWNPNDRGGSWSYSFSGLPSCTLVGLKDMNILAIDTNTGLLPASPYLPDTDSVDHKYNYIEGNFSGTPPEIVQSSLYQNMDVMKPFCGNILYKKQHNFGPTIPPLCIGPTGIKNYSVSGSLPSGLSYSIYFPEETQFPIEPYSNIGSGHILIQGVPTEFANGGAYSEELTLKIEDARGLEAERTFSFVDASVPNDPDIGIAVYFKTEDAVLSPKGGSGLVEESSKNWRPPPIEQAIVCNSILPHNKCGVLDIVYSGSLNTDTKVYIIEPADDDSDNDLSVGDEIYLKIPDANNDDLNGVYTVQSNDTGKYIDAGLSLTIQTTGTAQVIKGDHKTIALSNFNNFFEGNLVSNVSTCLIGGGKVGTKLTSNGGSSTQLGLRGILVPSFKTSITGTIPFANNNIRYSGLKFDRVNSETDIISKASWSDCWQTGNLYISGIIVPSIHAEIVDPPPAQDYFFSFNGARFALATRLAFGDNEVQRLISDNERNGTLKYSLTDLTSNTIIQSGSVGAGNSFDTQTLTTSSGVVYKLFIEHEADDFPTYDHAALPDDNNEYIWVHKGDNLSSIPTQNSFPPITIAGFDSISVTNSLTDSDPNGVVMDPIIGIAYGGYIPDDAGIGQAIPYNHSGTVSVSGVWSAEDFLPKISGVIQKSLMPSAINNLSSSYASSTNKIVIQTTGVSVGSSVIINVYDENTLFDTHTLIVETDNIIASSDYLTYIKDLGNTTESNLKSNIQFKSVVEEVTTTGILVRHNNLSIQSGDYAGIDRDGYTSTELPLLDNPGIISVASGSTTGIMLRNSNGSTNWTQGFDVGDLVDVYLNIDDNIKIMPYNNTFITEGKYGFQITGRSNVRENEDLVYKICTAENSGQPIFDSATYPHVGITYKKHFQNYALHVNKPISIVAATVNKTGNTLTFSTLGGKRPIANYAPDVQLAAGANDYSYCGFLRNSTNPDIIIDEYDSVNDRLNISFNLDPQYGIDWSTYSQIKIKISDETGTDEYTYTY